LNKQNKIIIKELATYCLDVISKYPNLAQEVNDLFVLCKDEIEAGGSTQHEINLCISSIEDLIDEQ
jgi:hypothetical protein